MSERAPRDQDNGTAAAVNDRVAEGLVRGPAGPSHGLDDRVMGPAAVSSSAATDNDWSGAAGGRVGGSGGGTTKTYNGGDEVLGRTHTSGGDAS